MFIKICLLLIVCSAVIAVQAADYGKLKPERARLIEKMPHGIDAGVMQLPWRLFVPVGASVDGPLPLVVFFHGAGRRGTDNIGAMELAWSFINDKAQKKYPCYVLAAQVPKGKRWVDQNFNKGSYALADLAVTPCMQQALELVRKTMTQHAIDAKRVYAVGQSMGGYGCWDALLRAPDLWAAGAPICGAGSPSDAALIKSIPVWAWHGENDTAVPVSGSRDMVEALRALGAEPRYTEIPKGGHGVWNKTFADPSFYEWLFAQKK